MKYPILVPEIKKISAEMFTLLEEVTSDLSSNRVLIIKTTTQMLKKMMMSLY
jgi:hypothetical protein